MSKRIQGGLLHRLTYFGAAAGLLFLWTLFEKHVIEPYRLYAYMPFYRVDEMCVWDVLAIVAISAVFFTAMRREGRMQ